MPIKLEFKRLSEVDCSKYIALNTNPLVWRQMPLTSDKFDGKDCKEWIKAKEKMWEEHGYGPWAFVIDDKFAGWGVLQPDPDGEMQIAGEQFIRYRSYAPDK